MSAFDQLQIILRKIETGMKLTTQEADSFENLKDEYGLNDSGNVKSIAALAGILNISRQTAYTWKKEGMPVDPDGSYDPEKIIEWRGGKTQIQQELFQTGGTGGNGEISEKVKWEIHFRKFRAKLAETAYQKEKGELISRGEVENLLVDRAVEFKKALMGRARRLSLRLAYKGAPECQGILEEDSLSILESYSRDNPLSPKIKKRVRSGRKKKT